MVNAWRWEIHAIVRQKQPVKGQKKTWHNACVDNTWISLYNTCNLLQAPWLLVLYSPPPVALEPNSGLGRLTVEVLGHTQLHKQTPSARLLQTSNHLIAEASTCTTHNKQKRRTSVPSAEFELAIPTVKWLQTYAVDYTGYLQLCT